MKVLAIFFSVLAQIHPEIAEIAKLFPSTIYKLNQSLGLQREQFVRYVTCPNAKCNAIYDYRKCVEVCGSNRNSKRCSCSAVLLKQVETHSGRKLLYPFKTYCYQPLKMTLQKLLNRPDFNSSCEKWRGRVVDGDVLASVYDGQIWQDFQEYEGEPFLSAPFTYGLMLNVDWFNPFKHTQYSLGAIYLTVINLPCELRYKVENVILIGLIPGPHEPHGDINSFLTPLVEELQEFLLGISMSVHMFANPQWVRCALLCVTCDIPACRKVCGFLGHSATLGCSRCMKVFPGGAGQKDYSGFDRSTWTPRTNEQHRQSVARIQTCRLKTEKMKLESDLGVRYSVLLELPYFDPVRMSAIDPMHNLYLGTAKHVLKRIWLGQDIISKKDYPVIQNHVDSVCVPAGIGRLPLKVCSGFAGFTADQYKNWTNLFSLFALSTILSHDDLECWRHFVLASRLLSQFSLSKCNIQLADALFLHFCNRVERMYGPSVVTPNLHLHCHLREVMLDYGPVYNVWLFSFERYNGILESFPTNNHSIEIQLMRRFIRETTLCSLSLPEQFHTDFGDLLEAVSAPTVQGSLRNTLQMYATSESMLCGVSDWTLATIMSRLKCPKTYIRSTFDQISKTDLTELYSALYPNLVPEDIILTTLFHKYSFIEYCGTKYKCHTPANPTIKCIAFVKNFSLSVSDTSPPFNFRPVVLLFFAKHVFYYNAQRYEHILASVQWLKEHHARDTFGKPLQLWWKDL